MNSFIQWNLQSYRTKFSELKVILNEIQPICVCIQETMIGDRTVNPPSQYNIFTSKVSRNDNHERGAAVLVHRSVRHEEIPLRTNLQAKAVKVHLKKSYTICSIYLPHLRISRDDLSSLISQLPTPFVLMGDFNARNPLWGDSEINEKGRLIEDLLLDHDISILNNEKPTHYHQQTNSYSIIDLCISSSDCALDFQHNVIEDLHDSDHFPTQLEIIDNINITDKYNGYNLRKADWDRFYGATRVDDVVLSDDVDEATDAVTTVLRNAADANIPRKCGRMARPPVPWWNAECDDAKRERTRAERALRRNYNVDNKIRYNRARAVCRTVFNRCRRQSWLEYLNSINSRTSINSVWKKVQKLSGKFRTQPSPMIVDDTNTLQREPMAVAETFAGYFASVGQVERSEAFTRYRRREEGRRLNMDGNGGVYNDNITMKELQSALSSSAESSPGHDDITYSMIKRSHPTLIELILQLFNFIFNRRVFPKSWLISIIIPFSKEGKDPAFPSNYRPISLTCCLCKLLEKIINVRLMWYLESEKNITCIQSGFRKNRSTTDHLVQLETSIRDSIANNNHLIAIFFDLQKAYDTAWRHGVLRKLWQYGMRGNLLHFMSNFLNDRYIRVRVNRATSTLRPTTEGVPQGSVLSCTCFLIAINDIAEKLPVSVSKALYVDDFAIYISGKRSDAMKRQLQLALNALQQWTGTTGFSFSPSKTATMHICRVRGCLKQSPELVLDNITLPHVAEYKYLGVLLDSSLTWRPHINNLRRSCGKTLNLLKCIANSSHGADRKTLLRLYIALLKPKLDYASEAYGSACRTLLDSLQPIQNAALRVATGALRTSPIVSLHAEAGLPPLSVYRDIKNTNFLLRLNANNDQTVLNAAKNYNEGQFLRNEKKPRPFLMRSETIIRMNNVDLNQLEDEKTNIVPPWKVNNVSSCDVLLHHKKSDLPPGAAKTAFEIHRREHRQSMQIFTDGSKTNAGTAYAFCCQDHVVSRKISPIATVFTAELKAISNALRYALDSDCQMITIFTDSRSAIDSIIQFNSKHPIAQEIQALISNSNKSFTLCWVPSHVGVEENEKADRAAREAVEDGQVDDCKVPRTDFQCKMKKVLRERWKDEWTNVENNKLREFKPNVTAFKNSFSDNRVWEVKLARLRIGHCKLTHQYLLAGGERPYCEDCLVPNSVKHFLIECPSLSVQRLRHFGHLGIPLNMELLLGENGPVMYGGPLHRYLLDSELYERI